MTKNEITNEYEMNLQETHLMRKLDAACEPGSPIQIDVNETPVTIRADRSGFVAATVWNGSLKVAYGVLASVAFMNLVERLQK